MTGYRFIKDEVMRRIYARDYPEGALIPNEVQLAQEFGVARATVNRALRELSDDGIVDRRRHTGTRVATLRPRHAKLEIPLIRAEIEATGATYRYALLDRKTVTAPKWLAARLALNTKAEGIRLKCLHFSSETPHIFEERWINLAAVPQAIEADFSKHNPNEWLVNAMPFTTAEFTFSAVSLEPATAKLLKAQTGVAGFVTERITWIQQNAVTYARMTFRPGYTMTTRI